FNPVYLDSSKITFAGFEKFSFNLYIKNLEDTTEVNKSIVMEFDSTGERWEPGFLHAFSEREDLHYQKEYTLDYAQSQVTTDPVFGTRGGAVLSLSDLLGNDNYFFLIYNTADVQSEFLQSFNIAMQRVELSERTHYGYGVFHVSGRRYD